MIIGVPSFAILYTVIKRGVESKLAKKALPTETEYYFKKDVFDIETNQLSFDREVLDNEAPSGEKDEQANWIMKVKEKLLALREKIKKKK